MNCIYLWWCLLGIEIGSGPTLPAVWNQSVLEGQVLGQHSGRGERKEPPLALLSSSLLRRHHRPAVESELPFWGSGCRDRSWPVGTRPRRFWARCTRVRCCFWTGRSSSSADPGGPPSRNHAFLSCCYRCVVGERGGGCLVAALEFEMGNCWGGPVKAESTFRSLFTSGTNRLIFWTGFKFDWG